MTVTAARRLVLAAVVLVPVLAAAPAHAEFAPTATAMPFETTVTEGGSATIKVLLQCSGGSTPCRFTFSSSRRDVFTKQGAVSVAGGTTKTVSWRVHTRADGVCVPRRTVRLDVNARRGTVAGSAGHAAVTLRDRGDCQVLTGGPALEPPPAAPVPVSPGTPQPPVPQPAPTSAPAPAPAPAPQPASAPPSTPQDSGTASATVTDRGTEVDGVCATPMWTGQLGAYGAADFFNKGCTITVRCPVAASTCSTAARSTTATGRRVTLNSRIHVVSAGGVDFWHRDTSCAGQDTCTASDAVFVRGGESAQVECNGVRADAEPNRARVTCALTVLLDPQG